MRVMIEEVASGAKGIWTAILDPNRLLKLASPQRQGGVLNVVMVAHPSYNSSDKTLQFDLDSAILLNLGNSTETILIDSREGIPVKSIDEQAFIPAKINDGDNKFYNALEKLPETLCKLGKLLLQAIRKEYPGELVFHPKSEKFVESPDNFWVIRIQPRVKSFRIVVYGRPNDFVTKIIDLKPDMTGYSSFLLDRQEQLDDAVAVIKFAKQLKNRR